VVCAGWRRTSNSVDLATSGSVTRFRASLGSVTRFIATIHSTRVPAYSLFGLLQFILPLLILNQGNTCLL
jgi:hypothetical protein